MTGINSVTKVMQSLAATAAAAAALCCGMAMADEGDHLRTALGISPMPISIPQPSGDLRLDMSDVTSIEVLGLSRAQAETVASSRSMAGLTASVIPAVVGDLFGMPPVSSNWESVRAAVASTGFASRPTVGVDE